jgi:transposase
VSEVQAEQPAQEVELWCMDEHRIGLKPLVRKVWALKGQRPCVTVQHRYLWLYLCGFVRPSSGETFWLLVPQVNSSAYSQALQEFATFVGCGNGKRIVLVEDNAGWHTSHKVVVPEGLHRERLPPYSPELQPPELQPAERLWSLTNEALVNQHFADLTTLIAVQAERCRAIQQQREHIRSRTNFHWWPQTG